MLSVALSGLAAVLLALTLLWMLSLRLRDASIIDSFWGPGFALATLVYYLVDGSRASRGTLVLLLVTTWAARLGYHLHRRNRRMGEDPRYVAMREKYGKRWELISLFRVFWLQGAIMWTVSAPLLAAVLGRASLSALDVAGAAIFLVGLALESLADHQLTRFRADPANKDKFITSGLWSRSRHPNYFGEILLWFGIAVIAIPVLTGWQLLTLISPVFVAMLLTRISGVNLLEASGKERWGSDPAYQHYVANTPALIPRIA